MGNKSIVINASKSQTWPDIGELFRNRGLIDMLAKRQIRGRYAQTALGIFWTLIQPVSYMVVLNLFFSIMARFPAGEIPYPLFLLSGLVLYQLFVKCLMEGATALSSNEAIIGKVFFPRLIFPLVTIRVASIDFAVTLTFLILLFFYYGFLPTPKALLAIVVIIALFLLATGTAILFSALSAKYRDLRLALPTITQLFLFSSPIMYDMTLLPERYHLIWALNPLVGLITAFRWCLFESSDPPPLAIFGISVAFSLVLLVVAVFYFQRVERDLVDAL